MIRNFSPAAVPGRQRCRSPSVPQDQNGTGSVVHAVLADRAEQHSGEPAVSPAADHEQVGTLGRAHQHVRGVPLDHQRLDHHVGRDAADLGERLEQDLARVTFEVDRSLAERRPSVAGGGTTRRSPP